MNELAKWVGDNIFQQDRLAVVLLVIFLLIFMGILPSPMLGQITEVKQEHAGIAHLLRQICVNTAKSQDAINLCFYEKDSK